MPKFGSLTELHEASIAYSMPKYQNPPKTIPKKNIEIKISKKYNQANKRGLINEEDPCT
jgi:hypothetical protein